jgi:hypothetical protein
MPNRYDYLLFTSMSNRATELFGGDILQLEVLLPRSPLYTWLIRELETKRSASLTTNEAQELLKQLNKLDLRKAVRQQYTRSTVGRGSNGTQRQLIEQITGFLRKELEALGEL